MSEHKTLNDADLVDAIAREVGVSHSTVRRCLSGAEARYGATARRMAEIRSVAERLGYVPNSAARALRRGRFDCVAMLGSQDRLHGYLPDALLSALHDQFARRGVRLTIARVEDAVVTDGARLRPLLQRIGADGLILDYIDYVPPGLNDTLTAMRLPMVWINRDAACDAVRVDDRAGVRQIALALQARGRRRIAYVDFSHDAGDDRAHYSSAERLGGWQEVCADGPCFQALVPAAERLATARAWLRGLPQAPDAVIGYTADHAAICMTAALQEGLPAPAVSDLGAVDESPWLLGASYVCARLPFAAIAAATVDLLLRRIDHDGEPQPAVIVPPHLHTDTTRQEQP